MGNEDYLANSSSYGSSFPTKAEYVALITEYKEAIHQVSAFLKRMSMGDVLDNIDTLKAFEQQLMDIYQNIERLGRSPPGVKFRKMEVLASLDEAHVELGSVLFMLRYHPTNPQAALSSLQHIKPCYRLLDKAAALMAL